MAGELGKTAIFGVALGVGVGIGLAVLAPSVFPQAARMARPYAKKAVKSGLEAYTRTREGLAEFGEFAEDVLAEARHEMAQAGSAATGAAGGAAATASSAASAKTGESAGEERSAPDDGAGKA